MNPSAFPTFSSGGLSDEKHLSPKRLHMLSYYQFLRRMLTLNTPASVYELSGLCSIFLGKYILEVNVYGGLIDEIEVEKITAKLEELTQGKEFLVLINCDFSARLTVKALQRLASKKAFNYAIAKASVISTPIQKISALFFGIITLFKKRPVKFFTDKDKAVNWLQNVVLY